MVGEKSRRYSTGILGGGERTIPRPWKAGGGVEDLPGGSAAGEEDRHERGRAAGQDAVGVRSCDCQGEVTGGASRQVILQSGQTPAPPCDRSRGGMAPRGRRRGRAAPGARQTPLEPSRRWFERQADDQKLRCARTCRCTVS